MGIHFVRRDLLGIEKDETRLDVTGAHADFTQPAGLIYEPQADKSLALVAIENVVSAAAWTAKGHKAPPAFHDTPFRLRPADPGMQTKAQYELQIWLFRRQSVRPVCAVQSEGDVRAPRVQHADGAPADRSASRRESPTTRTEAQHRGPIQDRRRVYGLELVLAPISDAVVCITDRGRFCELEPEFETELHYSTISRRNNLPEVARGQSEDGSSQVHRIQQVERLDAEFEIPLSGVGEQEALRQRRIHGKQPGTLDLVSGCIAEGARRRSNECRGVEPLCDLLVLRSISGNIRILAGYRVGPLCAK